MIMADLEIANDRVLSLDVDCRQIVEFVLLEDRDGRRELARPHGERGGAPWFHLAGE